MPLINVMPTSKVTEKKKELLRHENAYKIAINQQLITLKNQSQKWGKIGIIAIASLGSAYLVFNLLSDEKKKKKEKKESPKSLLPVVTKTKEDKTSWLVQSIKTMMLSVLIAVVKGKIEEALEYLKEKK